MSHRAQLITLLVLAVLIWTGYAIYSGMRLEDALITFRYAENLIAGHGLVYNVGERVLGTTTLLFALLLSAGGYVFGISSIPIVAIVISFVAMAAAGALSYHILRSFGSPHYASLLATATLLIHPQMVWTYCGGMETALVIFLMAASFFTLIRQQYVASGLLAALLVMTRPDGLLWAVMLLMATILTDRRAWLKFMLPCMLVGAIYVISTVAYYGTAIPHSILAKSAIGIDELTLYSKIRWWISMIGIPPAPSWIALVPMLCAIYAHVRHERVTPAKGVFLVYPFVFAGFFILGSAPQFPWYAAPPRWPLTLITISGLVMFLERYAKRALKPQVAIALSVIWLTLQMISLVQYCTIERAIQENEDGVRRTAGEWIERHSLPADRVAMEAIGYQGYYCNRTVIDMAGLISPQVVRIKKASTSNAEVFEKIVMDLRPEWIILRSKEVDSNQHFHGGTLFRSDVQRTEFLATHAEVFRAKAPHPKVWSVDSTLTIYQRVQ